MSPAREVCRILVCEDSISYAEGLTRFLEQDSDLSVVARCQTGEQAAARLALVDPDLVIMDIGLPGIDGIEATHRLMASGPVPVLVLSALTGKRGSRVALAALAAGAVDARSKSEVPLQDPAGARAVAFRRYIKRLAAARVDGRSRAGQDAEAVPRPRPARSVSAIGLAASTGGPPALQAVLGSLPADFSVPIVVVQHIADGFLGGLVRWLDGQVALPVRMAGAGVALGPGAWMAPEGAHLVVEDGLTARLDHQTVSGYHRPAADVLFASLASAAGAGAVAVVLTGMGSDGAEGAAAVRASGGLTIAQDQASSVVYGMPRAAAELGAERVLPLADIGPALRQLSPAKRRV
jgi:two-component system chemotaxis response regulator CheB